MRCYCGFMGDRWRMHVARPVACMWWGMAPHVRTVSLSCAEVCSEAQAATNVPGFGRYSICYTFLLYLYNRWCKLNLPTATSMPARSHCVRVLHNGRVLQVRAHARPVQLRSRSPLMRLASCMSLGMMVTRFAWMAARLVSSNSDTRYASAASCTVVRAG